MFVGARVGECSTTPKKQGRGPNGFPKRAIFAGLLAPGYLLSWTWWGLNDIQVTRLGFSFSPLAQPCQSQLCTHLASSGKVVLAIEHRDGTSPITWPLSEETGKRYPHFYVKPDDVM
jgi:hypothetical protein